MTFKLNKEYARNHLFVTLLMAGLGLWFAWDGLVRYPRMTAAALYEEIESAQAPEGYPLEAFKKQKIQTQYGFAFLALLASAVVGLRLLKAARFRFPYEPQDIAKYDTRDWEKKDILRVWVQDRMYVLDAWHHVGVKEFYTKLVDPIDKSVKI